MGKSNAIPAPASLLQGREIASPVGSFAPHTPEKLARNDSDAVFWRWRMPPHGIGVAGRQPTFLVSAHAVLERGGLAR